MKAAGVGGSGLGGGDAAPDYAQLAESFARDGYVVLEGLLSADQLAAVGASATRPFNFLVHVPNSEGSRRPRVWFQGQVRLVLGDDRV